MPENDVDFAQFIVEVSVKTLEKQKTEEAKKCQKNLAVRRFLAWILRINSSQIRVKVKSVLKVNTNLTRIDSQNLR